mgnify:CR=1 FL=1
MLRGEGDKELALGERGAEGITWKTVPVATAWSMHGIYPPRTESLVLSSTAAPKQNLEKSL